MHPQQVLILIQNWKVANSPQCFAAIQRDLHRLEKWADRNLMKFKKGYFKVLQQRNNNPMCKYIVVSADWSTTWHKTTLDFWWEASCLWASYSPSQHMGGDSSSLFSTGEVVSELIWPILYLSVQETSALTGASPVESHKDYQAVGTSLVSEKTERTTTILLVFWCLPVISLQAFSSSTLTTTLCKSTLILPETRWCFSDMQRYDLMICKDMVLFLWRLFPSFEEHFKKVWHYFELPCKLLLWICKFSSRWSFVFEQYWQACKIRFCLSSVRIFVFP